MSRPQPGFVAIVPIKPPGLGKSRLGGITAAERSRLAAAFALDTVAAAVGCVAVTAVLAVTDDPGLARRVRALGCRVVPDPAPGDLNRLLRRTAATARSDLPEAVPVALCADLPALRPAHLADALARWRPPLPGFVADAAGSGTTLYVAAYGLFDPRFGPDSRAAHLAAGAAEIPHVPSGLRQDVDDLADLGRARAIGLGPVTAAEVAARAADRLGGRLGNRLGGRASGV